MVLFIRGGTDARKDLLACCRQHIGERAATRKAIGSLDSLAVTGVGNLHKPTRHLMAPKAVAAS